MWTTPALRPLTEPLILDWELFEKRNIPSEMRYKALFPDDPEKRCKIKDIHQERAVLYEYMCSMATLSGMIGQDHHDPGRVSVRPEFYMNIWAQVDDDFEAVARDYEDIEEEADGLSIFKFRYLDNDGRTTKLEEWVAKAHRFSKVEVTKSGVNTGNSSLRTLWKKQFS